MKDYSSDLVNRVISYYRAGALGSERRPSYREVWRKLGDDSIGVRDVENMLLGVTYRTKKVGEDMKKKILEDYSGRVASVKVLAEESAQRYGVKIGKSHFYKILHEMQNQGNSVNWRKKGKTIDNYVEPAKAVSKQMYVERNPFSQAYGIPLWVEDRRIGKVLQPNLIDRKIALALVGRPLETFEAEIGRLPAYGGAVEFAIPTPVHEPSFYDSVVKSLHTLGETIRNKARGVKRLLRDLWYPQGALSMPNFIRPSLEAELA